MDLMRRIKSAFIIIIVIPILMLIGIGKLILDYQMVSMRNSYDVNYKPEQLLTNPLLILNRVTNSIFNKIKTNAKLHPEVLEEAQYLDDVNAQLKEKFSFLIVKKGDQIIYNGDAVKSVDILKELQYYGSYNTDYDGGVYIESRFPFFFKQQDFVFPDGTRGAAYVITDVNIVVPQIRAIVVQIVIMFVAVIIIAAVILIVWLYRSILYPLDVLKKATEEIRKGNLDYSISGNPDDEIGELCCDFEEMRIHLKELMDMRDQYEDDFKELIGNISHDLKTPLTAIKGYAEGIMDGVADTADKRSKYLKTIYTKAGDMTSLVEELSLFSVIDRNAMPSNYKEISISSYFNDCIDEISLDLELKNIHIKYVNKVDMSVKVSADVEQLKRVVNNVITNSVKYLGKDTGRIIVKLSSDKDVVRISIEDNGIGIAKKDLPFIFDRFYRADASRNTARGGTGLGLSIVKKIIEEHSGTIWAESEEGKGTRISFTLPIHHEEGHVPEGSAKTGRKERARSWKAS